MSATKRYSYIPAWPTLWPKMLWGQGDGMRAFPFSHPGAHYFYFARIAVYRAVRLFKLEGREVLVPAYHHGVEVEALVAAGAIPVFYRVGRRWDVDLEDVERRITPNTGALYLIHYAGFPGPAQQMRALADQHGLALIEDCALSLLSRDGDRPLGSTGGAAIFSIYKTLPVPNGGVLTLRDQTLSVETHCNASLQSSDNCTLDVLAAPPRASTFSHAASYLLQNIEMRGGTVGRALRAGTRRLGNNTARAVGIERVTTGSDHFDSSHTNLGMSTLSTRIIKTQRIDRIVAVRRRNYEYLLRNLAELSEPLFGTLPQGICPLFYPLVVRDKAVVMQRLAEKGVHSVDLWRDFHPACAPSDFPDAAWLRQSILEIPCHQDVTLDMAAHIVLAVRDALGRS